MFSYFVCLSCRNPARAAGVQIVPMVSTFIIRGVCVMLYPIMNIVGIVLAQQFLQRNMGVAFDNMILQFRSEASNCFSI